ncbi:hypothetical protein DPMN_031226 [Dreissena polymorpha]|uniref:Uncharacterized protein n=1 Tax=Dreissena polymorpha TaxID=45954 RepID=A0A9D4M0J7_DREPO|nr:hypothetical protein DPMN_031226 [Dreissena polymorpha]
MFTRRNSSVGLSVYTTGLCQDSRVGVAVVVNDDDEEEEEEEEEDDDDGGGGSSDDDDDDDDFDYDNEI